MEATVVRKKCWKQKCSDKNEIFRCKECGEATCGEELKVECVQTCKTPKQCLCKVGYARHNGICIPKNSCHLNITVPDCKIDEFENLQVKISAEIPTCRNREVTPFLPTPPPPSSSSILNKNKIYCVCAKGRVKNAKGKCILPKDCTETDNKHIYEKTSTNTNYNSIIKDSPLSTIILENGRTTNYLPNHIPLSKVPKKKDVKMPKIFVIPPPSSQEN
uniref:TIL domain-containing protein n=1 Tax=Panagrolaimus superbus TaxID=310955 RepID=A0A914YN60_9BILA